ncbi:FAD linked oxidase domain protein (plasmid) [Gemmatirosa kalamazoonensis]|uniref:D-lactate dehydrogenase (cytochrome) n=1 Tax=Gemmatirosa kalamazoonensis TaxID=861299 RepID=W0RQR1_9BACT|nr:FAD-linked oxidase C-terminal domain-containing protein [Gemmatirosa kalamazoonensis]AHG93319.1 FAD linked oxidase domain protein [Gemmatirosa kalamazoonensis]
MSERIDAHGAASGVVADLAALLGDRLTTSADERAQHGRDESYHPPRPPDAVAYPVSVEEVQEIVRLCARHGTPVIPFGAGSSLEGHVLALRGGVTVDMRHLDRILEVNAEDMDVVVEAGVTRLQLNRHLRDTGLTFPVDPGADATLGGMAATRASGTTAVRYGTMRANVLGLDVVLADGALIHTGGRARKSSAGYDLTHLLVGSEGTLGIIVRLRLRLHPVPEHVVAAVCAFPSVERAVDTVIAAIQLGIPLARAELLDERAMDAVRRYSRLDYASTPTLFFEFHGSDAETRADADHVQRLAEERGGERFRFATTTTERDRLWQARHDAYPAALALRPGARGLTTDVCVPISRLTECIAETKADLVAASIPVVLLGHVGDGNFHLAFMVRRDDPTELAEAQRFADRLVERALRLGGTCTGEHGVGIGKMKFMEREHGAAIDTMRRIKTALDPQNLMNPGKVIPARASASHA